MTPEHHDKRYPIGEYRGYIVYFILSPINTQGEDIPAFAERFEAIPKDSHALRGGVRQNGYTTGDLNKIKTAIDEQIEYETMIFKFMKIYRDVVGNWKEPAKTSLEMEGGPDDRR